MKTVVYIDGFNLYYGCLKGTPYKWLDLSKLCTQALPRSTVVAIKYFTARISAQPWDPGGPQRVIRQQVYLRALATLPSVAVYFGHFQTSQVWIGLVQPTRTQPPLVLAPGAPVPRVALVVKSEEKGSDVNLAAQLVNDAHLRRFDEAVVVSNDSDLEMPIVLVRQMGFSVVHLGPKKKFGAVLRKAATYAKTIRPHLLASSQFPIAMTDASGTLTKPNAW